MIDLKLDDSLPENTRIGYDLGVSDALGRDGDRADESWIEDWAPHLCLPDALWPDFVIKGRLDRLAHGSCRRPHSAVADGLVRVDQSLLETQDTIEKRPALLMMTGDQIYADDVAGPMLKAIHSLIERLGLYEETLSGSCVSDSKALRQNPDTGVPPMCC